MPRRWEGQSSLWMRGDCGCSEEALWGLLGKKRLQEPETSISQDSSPASSSLLMPTPSQSPPAKSSGLQPRPVEPRDPKKHTSDTAALLCFQETKHKAPRMKEQSPYVFLNIQYGSGLMRIPGGMAPIQDSNGEFWSSRSLPAKVRPALLGAQFFCATGGGGCHLSCTTGLWSLGSEHPGLPHGLHPLSSLPESPLL